MASSPTYVSTTAYSGENFLTMLFNLELDAANPPPLTVFGVQINGTPVFPSAITINSLEKTVKLTFSNTLNAGDIIACQYADPTNLN